MNAIFKTYNAILSGFKVGAEIVIFLIFVLIVADVFVRLAGLQPSTYTLGIVEYGLLWFTMLGAPWLVRLKGHVFVDSMIQLLPAAIQRGLAKLVYLLCICVALLFCYYSWVLLLEAVQSGETDIRGEDMPLWLLLVPMPVSFLMVAIEFVRYLAGMDTMYSSRSEVRENV